jgi:serine protease Do
VIVSKDGYVLTAAHVSGQPGRRVEFVLADGTTLRGKSLGANRGVDAGMMKIETQEDLPFLEMGSVDDLEVGDWCIAVGHPGGYKRGRTPPVRLGRIVRLQDNVIQTDCTLVGGDSGGPLFDLEGRVIAIHSRIGTSTAWNFHVPISLYRSGWDQLVASETWGGTPRRGGPVLGVNGEDHEKGALITGVPDGFPAKEAGIQPDDIITKVDGKSIKGFPGLSGALSKKKPGDEVELEILRGEETLTKRVKLGARR